MGSGEDAAAWHWLVEAQRALGNGGLKAPPPQLNGEGAGMLDLYLPLLQHAARRPLVVGHLGQSIDGYIATESGGSHYITGAQDLDHKHRLRALFDATLVGAATVRLDDPQLTARRVDGENPVRVVIDEKRGLGTDYHLFQDGAAETLVICDGALVGDGRHGKADVVGITPAVGGGLDPQAVIELLAARGLNSVIVEGGGITISKFMRAGVLDRLHLTVAPLVLGAGRAGLRLPAPAQLDAALRLQVRHYQLGEDMLFDCAFSRAS